MAKESAHEYTKLPKVSIGLAVFLCRLLHDVKIDYSEKALGG